MLIRYNHKTLSAFLTFPLAISLHAIRRLGIAELEISGDNRTDVRPYKLSSILDATQKFKYSQLLPILIGRSATTVRDNGKCKQKKVLNRKRIP